MRADPIEHILRGLYSATLYLLVPITLYHLIWRGFRQRAYFQRWDERYASYAADDMIAPVWLHAVSVGEVNAAAPLVNHLRAQRPDLRVVVTTITPTGSERVLALWGDAAPLHAALQRCLDDNTDIVAQWQGLHAQAQWPALAAGAHRLRGQAGNLGLLALQQCLGQLEQAARAGDAQACAQHLDALPDLWQALRAAQSQLPAPALAAHPAPRHEPAPTAQLPSRQRRANHCPPAKQAECRRGRRK